MLALGNGAAATKLHNNPNVNSAVALAWLRHNSLGSARLYIGTGQDQEMKALAAARVIRDNGSNPAFHARPNHCPACPCQSMPPPLLHGLVAATDSGTQSELGVQLLSTTCRLVVPSLADTDSGTQSELGVQLPQ